MFVDAIVALLFADDPLEAESVRAAWLQFLDLEAQLNAEFGQETDGGQAYVHVPGQGIIAAPRANPDNADRLIELAQLAFAAVRASRGALHLVPQNYLAFAALYTESNQGADCDENFAAELRAALQGGV